MSDYETMMAKYEADLSFAEDQYFTARPQINRTIEREKLFEAGYRMARADLIATKEKVDTQRLQIKELKKHATDCCDGEMMLELDNRIAETFKS